ncbi:MAG: FliI/YscN family ATPase, partial [Lachnospiraceae bacterium]|nr:FliI/YscN family ATPase [Lachnospiraceae bacterium]
MIDRRKYLGTLNNSYFNHLGKVTKVVGLTIESVGPDAKLNDLCEIIVDDDTCVMAEVVGFLDKRLQLMPFETVEGVGIGCLVRNTGHPLSIPVGDALLGHTVDGLGRPTDTDEDLELDAIYPVDGDPPDPMDREIISEVLPLGVKAVDGLITVGKGQRIGIFAGSGVGKSTLMGMFARNTKAEVNVIALIGERGREVREFVEHDLGEEGMARSVVVVATSDKPALIRKKAAMSATAIAEYFRDQGKDVLLMMDSLTRFSMAQREIGLASGEPPVTRGYPPSVYLIAELTSGYDLFLPLMIVSICSYLTIILFE